MLQVFINNDLRRTLGIYWSERKAEVLWRRCGHNQTKKIWMDRTHTAHERYENRSTITGSEPARERKHGRPKTAWRRTVPKMETFGELKTLAKNPSQMDLLRCSPTSPKGLKEKRLKISSSCTILCMSAPCVI